METEVHKTEVGGVKKGGTVEEAVARMEKTKPTPTQEENDRTAMGEHIEHHADDGAPEERFHPDAKEVAEKQKAARAKSAELVGKSKPTLTQDENDKVATGENTDHHEEDGSPEEQLHPDQKKKIDKNTQAKPAGATYETRAVRSKKSEEEKTA